MSLKLLVDPLTECQPHVSERARQLTFRDTILVYLEVAGAGLFPDQWVYVEEPALAWFQ
jgi:hypothetical protein